MKRSIKNVAPVIPPAAEKPKPVVEIVNRDKIPTESVKQSAKSEIELFDEIYQTERTIRDYKSAIDMHLLQLEKLQNEYQRASGVRTELLRDLPARLIAARENRPIDEVRDEAERLETGGAVSNGDGPTEVLVASSDPSVLPGGESDKTIADPPSDENAAWRDWDTRAAIENINRLGKGRLDAIVTAYPTLGALDDARVQSTREKKPLVNYLPKGTGEKIAAGIEEVLDAARAGKLDRVIVDDPVSKEIRIARSIYRSIESLTEDELRDGADEHWVDGSEAWTEGKTVDDAAGLGLEIADLTSWIRGWACTERYAARLGKDRPAVTEEKADGEPVDDAEEPATEAEKATEYNSAEVYDEKHLKFVRDMLKWFADGRKGEADRRSASNVDLWDLGFWSFGNEEPAEECPVEYEKPNGEWGEMQESDQVDWLRGWYFGSIAKKVDPKHTKAKSPTPEPPLEAKPARTLVDAIEAVEAEPAPRRSKANQLAYGKGYSAAVMKTASGVHGCPYDPEHSWEVTLDWVRGYYEGAAISDDDEL